MHLKQAMHLEDEGSFRAAEDSFIQANKPKEAVLMYVHAQDWDAAQRVAEKHDPESISDVLVGQARVAFQNRDYAKAEMFLLRANRPELAVRYYKEAGMWDDALRLAKEYLPAMLPELRQAYEQEVGGNEHASSQQVSGVAQAGAGSNTVAALLEQARSHEHNGNHAQAVEACLKLMPGDLEDNALVGVYQNAAELAAKFLPTRASEVTVELCQRLLQMDRYSVAADLFVALDMLREAVEVCVRGKLFDRARELADELEEPELLDDLKAAQVEHLQHNNDAGKLANVDVIAALDLYARNGQWDDCMAEAEKHGGQVSYRLLMAVFLV